MADREREEKNAGFTDASYIAHSDAPNTPRCYSYTDEEKRGTGPARAAWTIAGLCIVCLALALLNSAHSALYEAADANAKAETATAARGVMAPAAANVLPTAGTGEAVREGRPYLGVFVQTVSCAAAEYYNSGEENCMVPGVQIYAVDTDGPAFEAGLTCGDIIIRIDDTNIATAADLTGAESGLFPGESAVLIVYRAGEYCEVPVVFGEPPEPDEDDDSDWCGFDNAW